MLFRVSVPRPAQERRLFGQQELRPEPVGEKVLGQGFDENPVIDPDQMESGIFSDHDRAPSHALLMQRGHVGAGLRRHNPQARCDAFQVDGPEFSIEPFAKLGPVLQGDPWVTGKRCGEVLFAQLEFFREGYVGARCHSRHGLTREDQNKGCGRFILLVVLNLTFPRPSSEYAAAGYPQHSPRHATERLMIGRECSTYHSCSLHNFIASQIPYSDTYSYRLQVPSLWSPALFTRNSKGARYFMSLPHSEVKFDQITAMVIVFTPCYINS